MEAGEYVLSPGANYSKRWDLYQWVEDVAWVLIPFLESSPAAKQSLSLLKQSNSPFRSVSKPVFPLFPCLIGRPLPRYQKCFSSFP
jgi:hypothetical protein